VAASSTVGSEAGVWNDRMVRGISHLGIAGWLQSPSDPTGCPAQPAEGPEKRCAGAPLRVVVRSSALNRSISPLTAPDHTRRLVGPVAATGGGYGSRDGPDLGRSVGGAGRRSIIWIEGQRSRDVGPDGRGAVPSLGQAQVVFRFVLPVDHHHIAVPETGRGAPVP
jgi:hypothetical protein